MKHKWKLLASFQVGNDQLPILFHFECDVGPEHNLGHLANDISLFVLFVVVNTEKLVATRGCPGLFYLKTTKQDMAIINIGLSGLVLSIDPDI